MNRLTLVVTAVALALGANMSQAAVSAEEAAKLKGELTPLGAEKAGNKDGTIPAWDGGYTQVAPGYKNGDPRPDPFAGEKPLFSITGQNMDKYADKLTDGTKFMLKKYPDYRLDVYPAHRTAAAPQWVYDNTFKNATSAKLTDGGYGFEGAFGGIPFPIPKDGNEIVWNNRVAWLGESIEYDLRTWVVTPDGNRALASQGTEALQYPYYKKDGNAAEFEAFGYYNTSFFHYSGPPYRVGEAIVLHEPVRTAVHPRGIWSYLVGQRRIRRAPSVAYDTPDYVTSGIGFFDEAFMMFGPQDRFEWKLIGKKEIYIPYNNNRAASVDIETLVTPKFLNPDVVRWELHRVWVVEGKLRAGARHVVPRRMYYFDEDSWAAILLDGWDANGQLYRNSYSLTLLAPDIPALVNTVMWGGYNLETGAYFINCTSNGLPRQYMVQPWQPETYFSPESVANRSR